MSSRPTEVSLSLRECEPGALLPVCAKCGAPATGETAVTFHWFPKKILFSLIVSRLLCLILIAIFRTGRTVRMPVCAEHAGVWNWGRAILLGTTVSCLGLLLLGYALVESPAARFGWGVMLVALLGLFAGAAVGFWTLSGGVQPRLINEQEVILIRLNPDFVDAVENHSPEKQAAYDALRAARNPGEPRA